MNHDADNDGKQDDAFINNDDDDDDDDEAPGELPDMNKTAYTLRVSYGATITY